VVALVNSPPALTTIKKMDRFDDKEKKWLTPQNFLTQWIALTTKKKYG
jgi:hypothetical protein